MTERAEIRARDREGAGLDAASFDISWSSALEAGWRQRLAHPPRDRSSGALSERPRDSRYSWRTLPLPCTSMRRSFGSPR